MNLSEIKKGMIVYSLSGKKYRVLAVDKQRFPVLVKSVSNGTVGRFSAKNLGKTAKGGTA